MKLFQSFLISGLTAMLFACQPTPTDTPEPLPNPSMDTRYLPQPYVEIEHPEWTKNATIYEANIRQFTPEGTFKAYY